jgi:hypothetical protein
MNSKNFAATAQKIYDRKVNRIKNTGTLIGQREMQEAQMELADRTFDAQWNSKEGKAWRKANPSR